MSGIKWEQIINQIKNIKYPLAFFYKLMLIKNEINDYTLGIITSHYLKQNIQLVFQYPLFILALTLEETHPYTWKVLNNFYYSCYYIIVSSIRLVPFKLSRMGEC